MINDFKKIGKEALIMTGLSVANLTLLFGSGTILTQEYIAVAIMSLVMGYIFGFLRGQKHNEK